MKISGIIAAGGTGSRLGIAGGKQLLELQGKPILVHTIEKVGPLVDELIVVVDPVYIERCQETLAKYAIQVKAIVPGGKTRARSVYNGFIKTVNELVLIHDGARPFVSAEDIKRTIAAAEKNGAAVLCVKVKDTIKQEESGHIKRTPDRKELWAAQTPQVIKREWLAEAYEKLPDWEQVTDDVQLVEKLGKKVKIVEGSYNNIKITTKEDLLTAEAFLKEQ